MKRINLTPRPYLSDVADSYGFDFYIIDGEAYWDETKCYSFTLKQIEDDIEDPTNDIHGMLLEAVSKVVKDERLLKQFDIPEGAWDCIRNSWNNNDVDVYGRLDLCYDGKGPAKLFEANYDTPTSLFEAAVFQWDWLEDYQQHGKFKEADQFNSIHERLIATWTGIRKRYGVQTAHFAGVLEAPEDKYTLQYMMDTAVQAGLGCKLLDISSVGIGHKQRDQTQVFTDEDDEAIEALFKLYSYENLFREEFGKHIGTAATGFIEPPWKAVISNKAILPLLWQLFPNHPNLIESYFCGDKARDGFVRKAFFSREGSNILLPNGEATPETEYAGGYIEQKFTPLPEFGIPGAYDYPVIGSWVVGGVAAGIGIREDNSLITKNTSRFVPHIIEG